MADGTRTRDNWNHNPRAGYVWSPGHWQWNGNTARHVWVAGTWERARAGYAYRAPRWVERNGRWQYESSRWDRDGDGIPNRADATPYGEGYTTAPPAPRYERVPAPRAGYVWSPGHWESRSGRHNWIAGNWVPVRNGYSYTAPRWTERDRDGVPNRRDANPDNPYRR